MHKEMFKRKKAARAEASLLSFKLGYINLMITLVPFLLSIAAFSKLSILDLHLPRLEDDSGGVPLQSAEFHVAPPLSLTVAIEEEGVTVSNGSERITEIKHQEGRPDAAAISELMQRLKREHPAAKEVVILSRPKTLYADLVSVMDACRSVKRGGESGFHTLFPDVSLGEIS
jgi:biopolymer transport protein ExbD